MKYKKLATIKRNILLWSDCILSCYSKSWFKENIFFTQSDSLQNKRFSSLSINVVQPVYLYEIRFFKDQILLNTTKDKKVVFSEDEKYKAINQLKQDNGEDSFKQTPESPFQNEEDEFQESYNNYKEINNSFSLLTFSTTDVDLKFQGELKEKLDSIQIEILQVSNHKLQQTNANEYDNWEIKLGIENNQVSLKQSNYWRKQIITILESKIYVSNWYSFK
ncbi:hypothetical protein ACTA71_001490 [Dictyostelium dimigraforme]